MPIPARPAPFAVAVALVAAACAGQPRPTATPQRPNTVLLEGRTANDHGAEQVDESGEVVIEAGDPFFAPTVLLGSPGLTRPVVVRNVGGERHTFTAADLGVDREIDPGGTVEVVVTFPDTGTTVFECRFHRDQGMVGALVAT